MKKPTKTTKAVHDIKNVQVNEVMNDIGNLQASILTTLSGVSSKIAEKLELLNNTEIAVSDVQNRLNELYSIEKEAQVFEDIKNKFLSEQEAFNEKLEADEAEWTDKYSERLKTWQREEEQHNYDVAQRIKRFEDQFRSDVETKTRAEKTRQDELVKSWNTREAVLAEKENELKTFQKKVSEIDSLIKAESDKVAAIVRNEMRNSYEHQIQLLNKDKDAATNMFQAREQSLQIQVGQLVEQVVELNKQLSVARQDAKDVTSAALNSASGRQVVEALQKAMDSKDSSKK